MWLASTSKGFAELRIIMMIVLATLLVTVPPRHPVLRGLVGTSALILLSWTLYGTYNNSIKFVDSMSLLLMSISTALAALEQGFDPKPISFERKADDPFSKRVPGKFRGQVQSGVFGM
jgi:hypothetical protein